MANLIAFCRFASLDSAEFEKVSIAKESVETKYQQTKQSKCPDKGFTEAECLGVE